MNVEKHLIFLNDKDQTETISYCKYENRKWKVTFQTGKTYDYAFHNLKWYKNPKVYDSNNLVLYHNGLPLSGVDKVLDFEQFIRVIFASGYKKVYKKNELKVEQNALSDPEIRNVFVYLKQLAAKVSVKDEQDNSFLSKHYQLITTISRESVLADYLNPALVKVAPPQPQLPYFPFGFNLSQQAAAEKALMGPISVIEGPPGTGKTQTILNILANAVMNNKSVAVVSNNNAATANVIEKLQKYGVDFFAAFLGNKYNKDKFFSEQSGEYPDMTSWLLDEKAMVELECKLKNSGEKLYKMLSIKNEAAQLKQELDGLSLEKKYFNEYYYKEDIAPYRSLFRHYSETVLSLWLDFEQMAKRQLQAPITFKLKSLFKFGILNFSFYKSPSDQIIAYLQKLYYDLKKKELLHRISDLNRHLENYHFDESLVEYSNNSMKLFKAKLAAKYWRSRERKIHTKDVLWKDSDFIAFIHDYPVILSTTHSLRSCVKENYLFDYVIIDEASQVDVVAGALALSCAKNAVIVGDLQQLPNVVSNETAEETNRIFEMYQLNRAYHYAENSLLSSVTKLFEDIPRTLLREHYRCHPKIIGFCNQKFYNNQLIILTDGKQEDDSLVLYQLAAGNHARGRYNQREIDVILQEVFPQQLIGGSFDSVGIISPYRDQVEKLQASIEPHRIEVDTVHKYQGREKDVIILSTVVNEVNDFVDNPNLINVAISRAVKKLIVVVSNSENRKKGNIGDLESYIQYNNFAIIPSQIYSVFDLLYQNYSMRLLGTMKNMKKVSEYKSENLMLYVIEKVLQQADFQNLSVVMHQPLRMLIRNLDRLTPDERRFVINISTHTDFLIFNKMDKAPVLVVEVDGYMFHAQNQSQLERDRMKDIILAKFKIPILRISTNESGEEAKLSNKLYEVI